MTQYPIFPPLPQKRMLDTGVDSHLDGGHVSPLDREQEELLGPVEDAHVAVRPRGLVAVGHPVDAVALKSVRKILYKRSTWVWRGFQSGAGWYGVLQVYGIRLFNLVDYARSPWSPHPLRPRARC